MKKPSILLLLVLLFVLQLDAQIMGKNIVVNVQPDNNDWNYKVGQTARFAVSVLRSGTPVDNAQIDYEAGPVMYPDVKRQGVTLKDGTMTFSGKMARPGFYRLKVTAHVDGNTYTGLCTAAFSPEKLAPATQCPNDFDAFWGDALAKARGLGLDPHLTPLPDRSTQDVDVYEASFVNDRPGGRIFGILCVPKKPGRYPALLRVCPARACVLTVVTSGQRRREPSHSRLASTACPSLCRSTSTTRSSAGGSTTIGTPTSNTPTRTITSA
jgi:hypothetical protein